MGAAHEIGCGCCDRPLGSNYDGCPDCFAWAEARAAARAGYADRLFDASPLDVNLGERGEA